MSRLTDENIIIDCSVCWPNHTEQGLMAMIQHIGDTHKDYNAEEAIRYAILWMQDAYEREAQSDNDHADAHQRHACDCHVDKDELAIDKSIDADMEHQRHGV